MAEHEASVHPLAERIYGEASHWVRMANTLTWTIGGLFVPSSLAAVALVVSRPVPEPGRVLLAVASLALFGFWIYVSRLYGTSAAIARDVLEHIEASLRVPEQGSLYRLQRPVTRQGVTLKKVQELSFLALLAVWGYILVSGLTVGE